MQQKFQLFFFVLICCNRSKQKMSLNDARQMHHQLTASPVDFAAVSAWEIENLDKIEIILEHTFPDRMAVDLFTDMYMRSHLVERY